MGLLLGAVTVAWLGSAGREQLHAPGPMNTQHADLECESCHRPAPGTVRQQLQNAARDRLGLAAVAVDVGYREVTNDEDEVGKVLRQSPSSGTAKSGSIVTITVGAAAPTPTPSPTPTPTPAVG